MGLPLSYSIRNLWTRRLTTVLTASGMALVVFVFAAILMLAQGLQKTLVETGSYDNVIAIRKGSTTEVQSSVDRQQAAIIEAEPEVAIGPDGKRLLAKELLVLITLPRRNTEKRSNVPVRGICDASLALRPQVRLVEGRQPRPGSLEVITGRSVAGRFTGGGLGETLHLGLYTWTIVGVFDAGNTAFNSEVWGDGEQLMQAFRRPVFSSVIFKLRDPSKFQAVRERLETDPRLTLDVKQETRYYLEQSEMMAKFLRVLGTSLTIIFSLGAIIGAMITMYAAVAARTGEIGTLRALGFQRRSILAAFLSEALFLGLIGGLAGLLLASLMQFVTISTMNFQTFSELAFAFVLTPGIALTGVFFSLIMGFIGGLLPALRAARMNIVDALRV
ncbi:MAG: ABC transporter permease [Syntrophorhabdales bacterium]|jgi:ABC-type lipoprotein release transport system permease subunit